MQIDPEISSATIVMVGSFNPKIFHPSWLIKNDIEPDVPEDLWDLEICHSDVSKFTIGDTSYLVDKQRIQIQTAVAPWIVVLDKFVLLFSEILPHTPGRKFGINREVHFRVKDHDTRMKIGRSIAPIDPWGDFGKEMENDELKLAGGLVSLTMRAKEHDDRFELTKNVKIEPSSSLKGEDGVYMHVNFHYDPKVESLESIVELAQRDYQKRLNEAESIFDQIMRMN